jgi:thiol-disulfide isomerase/thioredoxin
MSLFRRTLRLVLLPLLILTGGASEAAAARTQAAVRNYNLSLAQDRQGWLVQSVLSPAPGSMTIRPGDRLREIEGHRAADLGPLQINWLLNQAFRRPLRVTVQRGGRSLAATIFRGDDAPAGDLAPLPPLTAAAAAVDFRLASATTGGPVTLHGFRGEWVLLNFWGTWCAPCLLEAPILNRLAAADPKHLRVVAVALNDKPEALRAFTAAHPAAYTIVNGGSLKSPLPIAYGVSSPKGSASVPASVLIAPDGTVAYVQGGFWQPSPLEAEVRRRLGKPDQ